MEYEDFYEDYGDQDFYDEDDLEDLLAAYQNEGGYNEEMEFARIPFRELLNSCMLPTLQQSVQMLAPLYALCILTRLTCLFGSSETGLPRWFLHFSTALYGLLALHLFFGNHIVYLVICAVCVYIILLICSWRFRHLSGIAVSLFIFIFVVSCELYFVDQKIWHSIRGAQVLLSMKVIGLSFDVAAEVTSLPGIADFLGYIFCAGSVIFGPWSSFQDYCNIYSTNFSKCLDIQWMSRVMKSTLVSVIFLILSTCFGSWLILDSNYKWIVAYRDAQSFRFSHYFVGYVSETTAALVGISQGELELGISVSKPIHIEVPRSLVDVVTNWNLPMHFWLKNYVFKVARPYGTFLAVILTYTASSLLHGLNFQLAAVLFSLGFYSYVETVFRNKLSRVFDACVQARKCREGCSHSNKHDNPFVWITNFVFGCLSVFHLAYLGLMFDSSSEADKGYNMKHTLQKWSNLGFLSHWVILGTYIFHLIV